MLSVSKFVVVALVCLTAAGCASTSTTTTSSLATPEASTFGMPAPVPASALGSTLGAPIGAAAEATDDLYYLEFRARSAESYGHTFVMFGKRDARGKIVTREVAGLHPASKSDIPYVLGHFIPVPSETGPSDGDLDDQYMTANYRVDLTKAEYDKVVGYIRKLQGSSPVWHAVLYNCSAFVADIANFMGLRTPPSVLFPENFINGIKKMNS